MSDNNKQLNKTADAVTDDHALTPREVRAAKLGQAWAVNPANEIELERIIMWRISLPEEEHRILEKGAKYSDESEAELALAIILDAAGWDSWAAAWDCWAGWLCLESTEEVKPEEVCAFIAGAINTWINGIVDAPRAEAMLESAHREEHGEKSTIRWADVSIQRLANCPTYTPALKRRSD